jgi:hypothetical protein
MQEYLVWQTFENQLSWFRLQAEDYVLVEPDANGIIRSSAFPGLWLAVPELLAGDMAGVINAVQQGLADPADPAFVEALADRT